MKRHFLLPSMLMALALASCAKNEVSSSLQPSDNLDVINLTFASAKNLSRGADATISTLEASGLGVMILSNVYDAEGANFANDDVVTYTYSNGWSQSKIGDADISGDELAWDGIDLPSFFYSLYLSNADAASGTDLTSGLTATAATEQAVASLSAYTFTQADTDDAGTANDHKDLLYAQSELSAIPVGGTASVVYYHALSKVDFFAGVGDNTVNIQKVVLNNASKTADIDINCSAATSWSNYTADLVDYGYMNYAGADITSLSSTEATENVKMTITTGAVNGSSMMIIPETLVGLPLVEGEVSLDLTDVDTKSFIEVIYNGTTVDGNGSTVDFAGYQQAQNFTTNNDDYGWKIELVGTYYYTDASSYVDGAWLTVDEIKTASSNESFDVTTLVAYPAAEDPLYVKVAYPFDATYGQEFFQSKYYHITLGMGIDGSTGGYLLSENLYDKDGNELALTVDTRVIEEGDPIIADASGAINIVVDVVDWVESDSSADVK